MRRIGKYLLGGTLLLTSLSWPLVAESKMVKQMGNPGYSRQADDYNDAGIGKIHHDQIEMDCNNPPLGECRREFLPPAEHSKKVGSGKNYIVILGINENAENGRPKYEMVQKGKFLFVGVRTGAGFYFGAPEEPIRFDLLPEEREDLEHGKSVRAAVMGLEEEKDGRLERKEKYPIFLYLEKPPTSEPKTGRGLVPTIENTEEADSRVAYYNKRLLLPSS